MHETSRTAMLFTLFPIFEEQNDDLNDENETEEPQNIQANSITPADFLHWSNVVRDFAQSHGAKMFTHYLPL